jgi:hypothetical protein
VRRIVGSLFVGVLLAAAPAAARDLFGAVGGYMVPLGSTSDFAGDGYAIEARWRHHNRGRSAFEIQLGYSQAGLEGEIQTTIEGYKDLVLYKNLQAQQQGGPGEGWLVAEYGTLEIFYGDVNFLYFPLKDARVSPFVSFGAGLYNWRLPFRVTFFDTPFFGEQNAYDPIPASGVYSGVVPVEEIDYTKHETAGGLSVASGASVRLTRALELAATARVHLIFSNGDGNDEEGIDDQDYLDNMTFVLLKGGLNWRF